MRKHQQGFTLIEIAIVLLIIGLLLGGVMKGQSLIDTARVRSIANDLSGIETAWISFSDRYRAIPGDYPRAETHIAGGLNPGNANALVDTVGESGAVWQHLASAGFISGDYNGEAAGTFEDTVCTEQTCPLNPYNGFYKIVYSNNASGDDVSSHELATGGNIPVAVMYELDLKIDDGRPDTGRFRAFDGADHKNCIGENNEWDVAGGSPNCAGVLKLPL